jgi:hypothetical protein
MHEIMVNKQEKILSSEAVASTPTSLTNQINKKLMVNENVNYFNRTRYLHCDNEVNILVYFLFFYIKSNKSTLEKNFVVVV